jgi:hypothetical protein
LRLTGKSRTFYTDDDAEQAAEEIARREGRSLSWAIRYLILLGLLAYRKGERLNWTR